MRAPKICTITPVGHITEEQTIVMISGVMASYRNVFVMGREVHAMGDLLEYLAIDTGVAETLRIAILHDTRR